MAPSLKQLLVFQERTLKSQAKKNSYFLKFPKTILYILHHNVFHQNIVTRSNIVWKFERSYCLYYGNTFLLVADSTECSKKFFIEVCSTLFVPLKTK